MREIRITGDPSKALTPLTVGRASAMRGRLLGVPEDLANVQIAWEQADGTTAACACTLQPDGEWGFYANGAYFNSICEVAYHVTARTLQNDSEYLGRGKLSVVQSVLNAASGDIPIIPPDSYARDPQTGLYHKLVAERDESGALCVSVEREGVVL